MERSFSQIGARVERVGNSELTRSIVWNREWMKVGSNSIGKIVSRHLTIYELPKESSVIFDSHLHFSTPSASDSVRAPSIGPAPVLHASRLRRNQNLLQT